MSRARLSLLSASILLAACSGGDDPFGNNDPVTQTFDITSTNGLLATKIAWESAIASGDLTDLGGSIGLTAAVPGGLSKASLAQPTGLVMNVMQKVPFGPDEFNCFPSGTFSISGDVENPLTLTADDTFTVLYTMCDDGTGEIVDGQIDFTVGDFSGDLQGGVYLLAMDAIVTNLQVITGSDTLTHNGDTALTLDTTDAPFIDAGTSGTSMTIDSNASSETIMNFQSSQTVDGAQQNLPYTMSASGTIDTTQLSGIVRYSTPLQFSGEGADYPSEGVLLVEGANSSARLTAVDNVNVMLELDVDGDGVVDQTIETTWAGLTT